MGCGSGKAAPVAVDHREEMDHRDQNGSAAAAAAAAAAAVPKAVAFEVVLDDQAASGTPKAKPPERLQKKATELPPITAEALQQKQEQAEHRRQEVLEERIKTSRMFAKKAMAAHTAREHREQSATVRDA